MKTTPSPKARSRTNKGAGKKKTKRPSTSSLFESSDELVEGDSGKDDAKEHSGTKGGSGRPPRPPGSAKGSTAVVGAYPSSLQIRRFAKSFGHGSLSSECIDEARTRIQRFVAETTRRAAANAKGRGAETVSSADFEVAWQTMGYAIIALPR